VKRDFATRSGAASGAHVAALSLGAAIGALIAVPAADALDSWHAALALAAIPAAVAIAAWPWLGPGLGGDTSDRSPTRAPSRTAVVLGVTFGCQGMCFAAMIAWAAAIYVDAGWEPRTAALATASIPLLTIPASLVLATLSDLGDRRLWVAGVALTMTVGLLGIAAAPTSVAWLWLGLFGIGVGAIFPLLLALALDHAANPLEGFDLSAWMLAIGFSMAAAGPVLIGALRDLTGGFGTGIGVLCSLAAAAAVLAVGALPPRRAMLETRP
jgi:CP family cyanate transporter-like MFS transporter